MSARLCSKMSSTSCSRPFARRTSALISSNFCLANASRQLFQDCVEFLRLPHTVQMESRHGQRDCSWKIVAQATKVAGNEQGQPDGIQPLVCSVESRVKIG